MIQWRKEWDLARVAIRPSLGGTVPHSEHLSRNMQGLDAGLICPSFQIFTIQTIHLQDERNRMSINLVKSEICIRFNYDMSCSQFYDYIKNNTKLLNAAKSSKKYIKS